MSNEAEALKAIVKYGDEAYLKVGKYMAENMTDLFVIAFNGGEDSEYIDLCKKGFIINAIKLRREKTGEGLREARAYIDNLRSEHGL